MKLIDIKIIKPLKYKSLDYPSNTKFYILTDNFYVDFITNEGTFKLRLKKGWITDLRSGSDAINPIVPRQGNNKYNAVILLHDCAWSGWISRELSNELLRQGMILSGEIGYLRASLAYYAVSCFGRYYELNEELPEPYTINRTFEYLRLEPK